MNIYELHDIVQLLRDKSIKIILFGSCALGEDTIESDIDVFVLTDEIVEVRSILKSVSLSRTIAAVVSFIGFTSFLCSHFSSHSTI